MNRENAWRAELRKQEERVQRYIGGARWDAPSSDEAFGDLALRSFRIQCAAVAEYGAYARHLGRAPDAVRDWRGIPPVPTSAFKTHDLSAAQGDAGGGAAGAAEPAGVGATFETSGTTISRPGLVRLGSTRLYEKSLLKSFAAHLLPEAARHLTDGAPVFPDGAPVFPDGASVFPDGAKLRAIVFGPTRADAPRSSLWFMVDRVVESLCAGGAWIVERGEPIWNRADAKLQRACAEGRPVILLGTTLLFHAYFERCYQRGIRYALPPGSRAMDTGGAKGARIELARDEVEAAFRRVLGVPPTHLVNEYGMAETGSQFYDDTLLAAHEGRARRSGKRIPPWVRTSVLDPETMRECTEGAPGMLVHYDLANLEIPLAIQTEDLGARIGDRLLLEGRLPEADRRGCSLPFEEFLERERQRVRGA